jgi:hypothetical protein
MSGSKRQAWVFIAFPAVAMLLGWGLRGYIGGGPFGALIPGVYVALSLCLLLGYSAEAAAMAALFGAVGIGYGGDMTYGQTLGFLRHPQTVYWGLLGCLVKGGVWGLLGGAVLGVGLTRGQYKYRTLLTALAIMLVAFYAGIKLINEPKLIYFSDRFNDPRAESWAGLLFAAIAFLWYIRSRGGIANGDIPLRFALWGALGGALGFAGGALFMVLGTHLPQKWIDWWKMMEFTFGLILGAALGLCAYLHRERLAVAGQDRTSPGASFKPLIPLIGLVIAVFWAESLFPGDNPNSMFLNDIMRLIFSFVFFGGICIALGMRSITVAWQIAITLTFFHTVLDFVVDLNEPSRFGYALSTPWQMCVLIAATFAVGLIVYFIQRWPNSVRGLYLLAVWSCYLTACARSFLYKDYFFPPEDLNALSALMNHEPSIFFVHGAFTISALITTVFIMSSFPNELLEDAIGIEEQRRREF